jgi:hypothetical protein
MNIWYLYELAANPNTPQGKACQIAIEYVEVFWNTDFVVKDYSEAFLRRMVRCSEVCYVKFLDELAIKEDTVSEEERLFLEEAAIYLLLIDSVFKWYVVNSTMYSIIDNESYLLAIESQENYPAYGHFIDELTSRKALEEVVERTRKTA